MIEYIGYVLAGMLGSAFGAIIVWLDNRERRICIGTERNVAIMALNAAHSKLHTAEADCLAQLNAAYSKLHEVEVECLSQLNAVHVQACELALNLTNESAAHYQTRVALTILRGANEAKYNEQFKRTFESLGQQLNTNKEVAKPKPKPSASSWKRPPPGTRPSYLKSVTPPIKDDVDPGDPPQDVS